MNETIILSSERAKKFGIIANKSSKNEEIKFEFKSIKDDKNKITVTIKIEKNDRKIQKNLLYYLRNITPHQATFIGWAFILLDDFSNKKNYRKKAKKFLDVAIKDEKDRLWDRKKFSCLPYFLLAKHNLTDWHEDRIRMALYDAIRCDDLFPDFFRILLRFEDNRIRKLGIVKKALKSFPKDEFFIDQIAENLLEDRKYKECEKFILKQRKFISERLWIGYEHLRFTFFKTLLKLKKFDEAEKLVKTKIIQSETFTAFLLGLLNYKKCRYKKAINYFYRTIQGNIFGNIDEVRASFYYLLGCFIKIGDFRKIKEIVEEFSLISDEFEIYIPFSFSYRKDAENILRETLNSSLDDLVKAKIKGLLAYVLHQKLPDAEEESERNLTNKEKVILKEGIKLVKKALIFYPKSSFFNTIYSNFLFLKKDYDEAMRYNIKTLDRNENKNDDITCSPCINLSYCSDYFLNSYADNLKEAIGNSSTLTSAYITENFVWDIGYLWRRKNYFAIANLYNFLESEPDFNLLYIEKLSKSYRIDDGSLFEIAYSLGKQGYEEQAKYIYEELRKIYKESSAVLNNLSLIYEKENNYKKAIELIKKAKKIAGSSDKIVSRNYERIIFNPEKSNKNTVNEKDLKKDFIEKETKSENLDYTDTATRKAWEKKWDVLQSIWIVYESNNKPDNLLIAETKLEIKDRTASEIAGILNGLKKEDCFNWNKKTNYSIDKINHKKLENIYIKTGLVYNKLAKVYQEMTIGKEKNNETETHKIEIVGGKIEVEGLKEGLKVITHSKKEDNKLKFPYKLPAGTHWKNIAIKFLDDENVYIEIKQFKHNTNFKEMGFVGKGNNPNPSEAWEFLKVLAKLNGN